MSTPAVFAEDLRVRYRTKKGAWLEAVRGLSFEVQPGEVVGFLGPNGAGKSSTLKALMGFVEPSGGTCSLLGHAAGSLESRARTGYLPEVALYYPYLTPYETLRLYGELQQLPKKTLADTAVRLLETVGLGEARDKQNRTLSKGMLQRVGIAQSLLGDPELLVLDEVTSGLDPVGRQELRTLLRERQARGATLFFSSHELSEVEMLCDRILVVHQGQLIEERNLDELKAELREFALVLDRPFAAPVGAPFDDVRGHGYRFHSKDDLLAALEGASAQGCAVRDVVAREGSLEDYFVETIGRAA